MIKLMKSTFYHEAEVKAGLAEFILKADVLSMGTECKKFEAGFGAWQGREHAVFVGSGSAANLVLIQSLLNLGLLNAGDKVGFSAVTWATNVMPIIQLGLVPVPVDCEIETLNASPRTIQVAGPMRALFLTNVLGLCDDLPGIATYCRENDILLLEDNCESLGSKIQERLLGNFGLASTNSFFVGHHLSTIEGGMVCTDDQELADMVTMVRAHGWDRNLAPDRQKFWRYKFGVDDFFALYTFYDLAYNARPMEINGFVGNAQLPYLDEIIERRAKNFTRFHAVTLNQSKIIPLRIEHMDRLSNFAMPLVFKTTNDFQAAGVDFKQAEAEIRPIIAGNILNQPFYKKYVHQLIDCPNANIVHKQGLYFANNPELTEAEVEILIGVIQSL